MSLSNRLRAYQASTIKSTVTITEEMAAFLERAKKHFGVTSQELIQEALLADISPIFKEDDTPKTARLTLILRPEAWAAISTFGQKRNDGVVALLRGIQETLILEITQDLNALG